MPHVPLLCFISPNSNIYPSFSEQELARVSLKTSVLPETQRLAVFVPPFDTADLDCAKLTPDGASCDRQSGNVLVRLSHASSVSGGRSYCAFLAGRA